MATVIGMATETFKVAKSSKAPSQERLLATQEVQRQARELTFRQMIFGESPESWWWTS